MVRKGGEAWRFSDIRMECAAGDRGRLIALTGRQSRSRFCIKIKIKNIATLQNCPDITILVRNEIIRGVSVQVLGSVMASVKNIKHSCYSRALAYDPVLSFQNVSG